MAQFFLSMYIPRQFRCINFYYILALACFHLLKQLHLKWRNQLFFAIVLDALCPKILDQIQNWILQIEFWHVCRSTWCCWILLIRLQLQIEIEISALVLLLCRYLFFHEFWCVSIFLEDSMDVSYWTKWVANQLILGPLLALTVQSKNVHKIV